MDKILKTLLNKVIGENNIVDGAFNLRINGSSYDKKTTKNINIVSKNDKEGLDIFVSKNTKGQCLHIPVLISKSALNDVVNNDYYIEDNCDVTIIAACAIHNPGISSSRHGGYHNFHIGKNSKVNYIEKHYGSDTGKGEQIIDPVTIINIAENGYMEINTEQIKGLDSSKRFTRANLSKSATLIIKEKIMTHNNQYVKTEFEVDLNGSHSSVQVTSRSIARDSSRQIFISKVNGNNICTGHTECDGIIMDNAKVSAIPEVSANHVDANLIHEAVIGKIAKDQMIKLMTLGLTEEEAESKIIEGFLK